MTREPPYDPILDHAMSGGDRKCRRELGRFIQHGNLFAALGWGDDEPTDPDYQPFRLFPQAEWDREPTDDNLPHSAQMGLYATITVGINPYSYFLYLEELYDMNGWEIDEDAEIDVSMLKMYQQDLTEGYSHNVAPPVVHLVTWENRDRLSLPPDDPEMQAFELLWYRGVEATLAALAADLDEMPLVIAKKCTDKPPSIKPEYREKVREDMQTFGDISDDVRAQMENAAAEWRDRRWYAGP